MRIAAEEEGQTITVYCRQAIMEKAAPEPELPDVAMKLPDHYGVEGGVWPCGLGDRGRGPVHRQ